MKEDRLVISLWDWSYISGMFPLIILKPTGVFYSNQAGGGACLHPEAEGFLIAVHKNYKVIDDCKEGCYKLNGSDNYLEFEDNAKKVRRFIATEINKKLIEIDEEGIIRFDFERVDELREAWWPVIYKLQTNKYYNNDKVIEFKAILCSENCD